MAIIYDPNKKIFTLHTAHTTYQMQVDPLGYLLHLYYGEKTNSSMDYVLTYADRGFSGNPYAAGMDRTAPIRWMRCHRSIRPLAPEITAISR